MPLPNQRAMWASSKVTRSVAARALAARDGFFLQLRGMMADAQTEASGPIAQRIREKLQAAFAPEHLDVLNESYMHNVPKGSETHFKVVVVAEQFQGKPLLQRHRMVNAVLEQELNEGVHALSILSKTPAQWASGSTTVQRSPSCRGGLPNDPTKQEFLKNLKGDK